VNCKCQLINNAYWHQLSWKKHVQSKPCMHLLIKKILVSLILVRLPFKIL
jgi:hypothetical protein